MMWPPNIDKLSPEEDYSFTLKFSARLVRESLRNIHRYLSLKKMRD
jgi:hypothetical protein